ncbi:hypothetical protein VUR80DRAFT_10381 [Thermomyces stellatus]
MPHNLPAPRGRPLPAQVCAALLLKLGLSKAVKLKPRLKKKKKKEKKRKKRKKKKKREILEEASTCYAGYIICYGRKARDGLPNKHWRIAVWDNGAQRGPPSHRLSVLFALDDGHSNFCSRASFSRNSYQSKSSTVLRSVGLGTEISHLLVHDSHLLLNLGGRDVDRARHLDIKLLLMSIVCLSGLYDVISFSSHSSDSSIDVSDVRRLILLVGYDGCPSTKVEEYKCSVIRASVTSMRGRPKEDRRTCCKRNEYTLFV